MSVTRRIIMAASTVFLTVLLSINLAQAGDVSIDPEFESFVQSFFAAHITENHTPGAVFVLTDANGPVMMRGYGRFRFDEAGEVIPGRHLFRIASITKTFTAVAIMQLVERGLIDLDSDVNLYLKHIQLEDRYDAPVTVRNLLQHTSGIEEQFTALSLRSPEERVSMTEYFKTHPPIRSYPPGQYTRYTNRAYMLLGHVIEDVSGEIYEEYMRRNVTEPLGMFDTVFDPSKEQVARLSPGVFYDGENFIPAQTATTVSRPSGDYISSARDMSRYIQMFLNGGEVDGRRILSSESVRQMTQACYTHHPEIEGMCLGLRDFSTPNGFRVLSHGGYYGGWNADLVIFPDKGMGYFAATNGDAHFQKDFLTEIVQPLFGVSGAPEDYFSFSDFIDRADEIAGSYRSQFVSGTYEKTLHLFNGDTRAEVKENGVLEFGGRTYRQLRPLVFRDIDSGHQLVFIEGENGQVKGALTNPVWEAVYDKLPMWQTTAFQTWFLIICLVGVSLSFIVMSVFLAKDLLKKRVSRRKGSLERSVLVVSTIASLLWVASWLVLWFSGIRHIGVIMFGVPAPLAVFMFLNRLAGIASLVFLGFAGVQLVRPNVNTLEKIAYVMGALFCGGLSWWAWYWRII